MFGNVFGLMLRFLGLSYQCGDIKNLECKSKNLRVDLKRCKYKGHILDKNLLCFLKSGKNSGLEV